MSISERGISRRSFLIKSSIAALLGACDNSFILQTPQEKGESHDTPWMGDIIMVGSSVFLLRDNKSYEIPDLQRYKRATKFDKFGRKIFQASSIGQAGEVPKAPLIIDPFTGQSKDSKRLGGEINIYFPGFMTDAGVPFDLIKPAEDTFIDIRKKLKSQNWELFDSFFFTYGERGVSQYHTKNTAKSPKENTQLALDFFTELKKLFPLCQFNLIGHSLGGVFALEVARKNQDAVSNLVLINSPIKGIEGTIVRKFQASVAKSVIPFIGDEKVTDYLFNLWDNNKYQKDLDDFGSSFTKAGRGLTTIASDDDPIVPREATLIKGASSITLSVGGVPIEKSLEAHGKPLKNALVIDSIAEKIGENLSR